MFRFARHLSLAPTALAIVVAVKFLFPAFEDPDFYWHLKTGEALVAGSVSPYADFFTHTSSGNERVLSAWLAELIFYLIFAAAGYAGISLFVALLYMFCWSLSYAISRKIVGDEAKAVIGTLVFCGLFGAVAPRPHLFTFLGFAALLYLLLDFKYFGRERRLWLIPAIMLLWANLHGGFFLGLVLLAVFLSTEWLMQWWRASSDAASRRRLKRLTAYALVALLATAVNPHGFEFWLYPYRAIVSSGDMVTINEWQSPNFHSHFFQYFLVTVFGFFVCIAYSRRRPDLTELVVPLVFVAGAFLALRNVPLAALAMAPFFVVHYKELGWDGAPASPRDRSGGLRAWVQSTLAKATRQLPSRNEGLLNLAVLVTAIAGVALIYPAHQRTLQASIDELLPVKAADFVLANGIEGRMFNTYHYGGYLLFRLYPAQKVFVYGRTDIYPRGFLDDYNAVYRGKPGWKALFDGYAVDYIICESKAPIRQLLLAGEAFRLVYDDTHHSVLVRDAERFRDVIARHASMVADEGR